MPGSPACYHDRVIGGQRKTISLPPAQQSGTIKFGRVFLSLGAMQDTTCDLNILKRDGTRNPRFPQSIFVRRGRQIVYELEGGSNPDAVARVDLVGTPATYEVSVLVETDSP
jgi:hypothetical protein